MKRFFVFAVASLSFLTTILKAQVVEEFLISSGGDTSSSTNSKLDWSIGEAMIEPFNNSVSNLEQGFLHVQIVVTGLSDNRIDDLVKVYPNPFAESVKVEAEWNDGSKWQLLDFHGKLLYDQPIPESGVLNLEELPSGIYYLKVKLKDINNSFAEIKLIKSQ